MWFDWLYLWRPNSWILPCWKSAPCKCWIVGPSSSLTAVNSIWRSMLFLYYFYLTVTAVGEVLYALISSCPPWEAPMEVRGMFLLEYGLSLRFALWLVLGLGATVEAVDGLIFEALAWCRVIRLTETCERSCCCSWIWFAYCVWASCACL